MSRNARDQDWCWHKHEAAKCPYEGCGYKIALEQLAAANAHLKAFQQALAAKAELVAEKDAEIARLRTILTKWVTYLRETATKNQHQSVLLVLGVLANQLEQETK